MSKSPDYTTKPYDMTDDELIENIQLLAKAIAFDSTRAELMMFQKRLRDGDVFD